jgi:amidase
LADVRVQNQKEYLNRWVDADIDALITPVQTYTGYRPRTWVRSKQWVGYTAIWNWLGYASLAVPVTTIGEEFSAADEQWEKHVPRNESDQFNKEICRCHLPFAAICQISLEHLLTSHSADEPELVSGMPLGVLVVGGKFGEEKTVAAAKVIEKVLRS